MVRTQIQLTEDQYARLKAAAQDSDIPMAELIRRAVDRWFEVSVREQKYTLALGILGKYQDAQADVSERHDEYLREIWDA